MGNAIQAAKAKHTVTKQFDELTGANDKKEPDPEAEKRKQRLREERDQRNAREYADKRAGHTEKKKRLRCVLDFLCNLLCVDWVTVVKLTCLVHSWYGIVYNHASSILQFGLGTTQKGEQCEITQTASISSVLVGFVCNRYLQIQGRCTGWRDVEEKHNTHNEQIGRCLLLVNQFYD